MERKTTFLFRVDHCDFCATDVRKSTSLQLTRSLIQSFSIAHYKNVFFYFCLHRGRDCFLFLQKPSRNRITMANYIQFLSVRIRPTTITERVSMNRQNRESRWLALKTRISKIGFGCSKSYTFSYFYSYCNWSFL